MLNILVITIGVAVGMFIALIAFTALMYAIMLSPNLYAWFTNRFMKVLKKVEEKVTVQG